MDENEQKGKEGKENPPASDGLEQLTKEDLIAMARTLKKAVDENQSQSEATAKEREKLEQERQNIMRAFLNGQGADAKHQAEQIDPVEERLINKFKRR